MKIKFRQVRRLYRRRAPGPDRETPGRRRPGRLRGMVRPPAQAAAQSGEKPDRRGRGPGRAGHPAQPALDPRPLSRLPPPAGPGPPVPARRHRRRGARQPDRAGSSGHPRPRPTCVPGSCACSTAPSRAWPTSSTSPRRSAPSAGPTGPTIAARSTSTCSASPSTPVPIDAATLHWLDSHELARACREAGATRLSSTCAYGARNHRLRRSLAIHTFRSSPTRPGAVSCRPSPLLARPASPGCLSAACSRGLERWVERRRQRRALLALDDNLLKDIGLSAADAWHEGTQAVLARLSLTRAAASGHLCPAPGGGGTDAAARVPASRGRASGRAAPLPRGRRHRLGRGPARPGPADPAAWTATTSSGSWAGRWTSGTSTSIPGWSPRRRRSATGCASCSGRSSASAWATSYWPTRWAAPAARSARPRSASSRSS